MSPSEIPLNTPGSCPVLHFQTHRLHQIALAVSAFAVAHRAVISQNLFCGSQHFRRGFHGIFFLYRRHRWRSCCWRCRRRCSRRGPPAFPPVSPGLFSCTLQTPILVAIAMPNTCKNIAHERLPRKSLARLFQGPPVTKPPCPGSPRRSLHP